MRLLRFGWLLLVCLQAPALWAVEASTDASAREVMTRELWLGGQQVGVHVWLERRQVWAGEGLKLYVQLEGALASAQISWLTGASSVWHAPQVSPVRRSAGDHGWRHEWTSLLFSRTEGVHEMPALTLIVTGDGGARARLILPRLKVRVRPLPSYVPAEAVVGRLVLVDSDDMPSHVQVGSLQSWQQRLVLEDAWPEQLWLAGFSGSNLSFLQASTGIQTGWTDAGWRVSWQVTRPWLALAAGRWTMAPVSLWVFDPQTARVTHWQSPEVSGVAWPAWVGVVVRWAGWVLLVAMILLFGRLLFCRWQRRHYWRGIDRAADALQLLQWLAVSWHWSERGVPASRQPMPESLRPLVARLEGLQYRQGLLFDAEFVALRTEIKKTDLPPCRVLVKPLSIS